MKINYKQLFLNHHDASLDVDSYDISYDFEMSEEYTADGYSIFLCRYYSESIVLEENIYYYDHDLLDLLKEKIEEGLSIYCPLVDNLYLEEQQWIDWCEDAGIIEWDNDESEWELVGEEE
jgi:hypothetical protein